MARSLSAEPVEQVPLQCWGQHQRGARRSHRLDGRTAAQFDFYEAVHTILVVEAHLEPGPGIRWATNPTPQAAFHFCAIQSHDQPVSLDGIQGPFAQQLAAFGTAKERISTQNTFRRLPWKPDTAIGMDCSFLRGDWRTEIGIRNRLARPSPGLLPIGRSASDNQEQSAQPYCSEPE